MASGKELPIGGAGIAPLTPGEGEGAAAPGEQGGDKVTPGGTPEGSVAQPGVGEPGGPAAQPGEGEGAAGGQPAAKPGPTAEERIQALTAEVGDLKSQLAAVEDLQDLADELEESLTSLRGLAVLESDSPTPPGGAVPGAKPVKAPEGVEAQIQSLAQQVNQLQGMIQKATVSPEDRTAYQNFQKLEGDLIKKAGIENEKEVEIVRELITTTMDKGNLDWGRPRVAKRVIRGAIDKFKGMKTAMLGGVVQPGAQPVVPTGEPAPSGEAARYTPAAEKEDVDPLDQAAQELGPMIEAVFGRKGGGVI